jgi:hypothetical protein
MIKEIPTFVKLNEPHFEKIFEVHAVHSNVMKIRGFAPELSGSDIVLPVEFTKTDGERVVIGFPIETEHLRDLLAAAAE